MEKENKDNSNSQNDRKSENEVTKNTNTKIESLDDLEVDIGPETALFLQ